MLTTSVGVPCSDTQGKVRRRVKGSPAAVGPQHKWFGVTCQGYFGRSGLDVQFDDAAGHQQLSAKFGKQPAGAIDHRGGGWPSVA